MAWFVSLDFPESQKLVDILKQLGKKVHTEFNFEPSGRYIYHGGWHGLIRLSDFVERPRSVWTDKNIAYVVDYCTLENYKCSYYYPILQEYMLNKDHVYLHKYNLKNLLYAPIFIRPNSGKKYFTGMIADSDNINIPDEELILVSAQKEIGREWRVFCTENGPVAWSQYKPEIIRDTPDEVLAFAGEVAQLYQPDKIFSIDICESDGKLFVVELNSFSCAGLYDCKLATLIKTVEQLSNNS